MLKAIVRINIGKHDVVRPDEYPNNDWEKITFTDLSEQEYRKWSNDKSSEVITIDNDFYPKNLSNKKKSSFLGITALNSLYVSTSVDFDLVLWIAGDACIIGDMNDFTNMVHKGEVSSPKHPSCDSAIEDAEKILAYEKDSFANLTSTLVNFSNKGFKHNNGYHETSGLIKSNTEYARTLETIWASEYLNGNSVRDQIYLPFSRHICDKELKTKNAFYSYEKKSLTGYFK